MKSILSFALAFAGRRAAGRVTGPLLALVTLGLGACTFEPRIPNAVVTCTSNLECPQGLVCHAGLKRCCRPGTCGDGTSSGEPPAAVRSDAGASPAAGSADAAATDAAPEPVPPASAADAGTEDGSADANSASDAPAANVLTCNGTATVPAPVAGRETLCTIYARAGEVMLALHAVDNGDPVSVRTYGICFAPLPLARETTDGTGAGRPLSNGSLATIIDLSNRYKQICNQHQGRMVGAAANGWARQATNRAEIEEKFRAGTGLALDVVSATDEINHLYLGHTRNRKGRAMVFQTYISPEIVTWTRDAPAPVRTPLPVSYEAVNSMYLGNPAHLTFADMRRSLRGRLVREMEASLRTLRLQVTQGLIDPGFVVAADALVPLAIAGHLRDTAGKWDAIALQEKKRNEATVMPSPYGRIYGRTPITPAEVDAFFTSVDDAQWTQLRSDPLRTAYGGELIYLTVALDILGDEVKASEFAFVYASSHLGYLFAKAMPPPS